MSTLTVKKAGNVTRLYEKTKKESWEKYSHSLSKLVIVFYSGEYLQNKVNLK